jgi:ATP-dependent Clp protease ATP-binding subunit ClpA
MFERFTEKARTVVVLAQQDARERGDSAIDTGHVLRALFAVPDNLAVMVLEGFSVRQADVEADLAARPATAPDGSAADADALAALGIDLDEVRRRVEEAFGPGALDRPRSPKRRWIGGHIPFAKEAKKALELALREAIRLKQRSIHPAHLLLGILRAQSSGRALLLQAGVDIDALRSALEEQTKAA